MSEKGSNIATAFGYSIAKKVVFSVFLMCSAVLWLPFILLEDKYPKLPLKTVGGFIGICSFGASWILAGGVVARMHEDDSMTFGAAFSHTLYASLAMLCFVPFVGFFFERFFEEKKATSPFRDPQSLESKKKEPNQAPEPTAPSGRGSS
jgi:hypothetical protein